MKVKRSALLALLFCLAGASAFAQIAPNNQGDIGLFTMPTRRQPARRASSRSASTAGWSGSSPASCRPTPITERASTTTGPSRGSVGLGLTDHWSIFASAGWEKRKSRGGWQGGIVNGLTFRAPFDDRRRPQDPDRHEGELLLRGGLRTSGSPSSGRRTSPSATPRSARTSSGIVADQINSRRADWEWGGVLTKGDRSRRWAATPLSGRHDQDIRPANRLRFGAGVDVPIVALPARDRRARPHDHRRRRLPRRGLLDALRRRPVLARPHRASRSPPP